MMVLGQNGELLIGQSNNILKKTEALHSKASVYSELFYTLFVICCVTNLNLMERQ